MGKSTGHRVDPAPMTYNRLWSRAQNLLQELPTRFLDRSHSAAMNQYFNRACVEALDFYPLGSCDVRHFWKWFDRDGFLLCNR